MSYYCTDCGNMPGQPWEGKCYHCEKILSDIYSVCAPRENTPGQPPVVP